MSAAENLLRMRGAEKVDTVEIEMNGETVRVDRRRARSYVSRGMAVWSGDEATQEPELDFAEPSTPSEPAEDSQVADSSADYEALSRDELSALAKERDLPFSGTKTALMERLSLADAAGVEDEATAGDEPLSGSDSDGN